MKFLVLAVCGGILISCVSGFHPPTYNINKVGDLMTTNSPMLIGSRDAMKNQNGKVVLVYKGIVENTSKTASHTLQLQAAAVDTNGYLQPAKCQAQEKQTGPYVLKPLSKVLVECEVSLVPNSQNKLLSKDTVGQLLIPVDERRKQALSFQYLFRIEDFE